MLKFLKLYHELQIIDADRLAVEKQLATFPATVQEWKNKLATAHGAWKSLLTEQTNNEAERRKLATQTNEWEAKIAHYQEQQRQVTNEKQLAALEHEIASARKALSPIEERQIEIILRADELAKEIPMAEEAFRALEAEAKEEKERIREQLASKKEALALLDKDRDVFWTQLNETEKRDYADLALRFPGRVVAPIAGETCGGCFTKMQPNILAAVRKADQPVRCDQCRRFIFLPEDAS